MPAINPAIQPSGTRQLVKTLHCLVEMLIQIYKRCFIKSRKKLFSFVKHYITSGTTSEQLQKKFA
jgi:hypothetical protein